MLTRDTVAAKLLDRLGRKCNAVELTHWAKGLMFDSFENRLTYEPDFKDLLERAVLRIANASTNYRTFLFNSEIVKMLSQLDRPTDFQPSYSELYSINIIIGQQNSQRSQDAVKKVAAQLSEEKHLMVRQQGSGIVISADHLSEAELHDLAHSLDRFSFIMSLKDFKQ